MGARRGGRARAEAHGRTATRGAEPASALSYGQSLSRTRPLMSPRSRPCAGCSVSANWPQCPSSRGPPPASPRATPASPKIIKRAWHAAGRETASARAPPGTSPVIFKVEELGLRKGCPPHVDGAEGRPRGRADAHSFAFACAGHSGLTPPGPPGQPAQRGGICPSRWKRAAHDLQPGVAAASSHARLRAHQGTCPSARLAHCACSTSDRYVSYLCVNRGAAQKPSNA